MMCNAVKDQQPVSQWNVDEQPQLQRKLEARE